MIQGTIDKILGVIWIAMLTVQIWKLGNRPVEKWAALAEVCAFWVRLLHLVLQDINIKRKISYQSQ